MLRFGNELSAVATSLVKKDEKLCTDLFGVVVGICSLCRTPYGTGSKITNHAWVNDHIINFDERRVADKGLSRDRKTLELLRTDRRKEGDNNVKQLPKQYLILLKK